jgi:hypothetical protein
MAIVTIWTYVNQYNMKATAVARQTTGVVKYNGRVWIETP